jgi:hypothetical protein
MERMRGLAGMGVGFRVDTTLLSYTLQCINLTEGRRIKKGENRGKNVTMKIALNGLSSSSLPSVVTSVVEEKVRGKVLKEVWNDENG